MTDFDSQPLALQPPSPDICIRPVMRSDALALHDDCWSHRTLLSSKDMIRRMEAANDRNRGIGMVAQPHKQSQQVVGYGQLLYWGQNAEISNLIVSADYRRKGIGTAIIQHLIQYAIRHDMQRVEIGVALSNPRALALYLRVGFTRSYQLMLTLAEEREPVQYLQLDLPTT